MKQTRIYCQLAGMIDVDSDEHGVKLSIVDQTTRGGPWVVSARLADKDRDALINALRRPDPCPSPWTPEGVCVPCLGDGKTFTPALPNAIGHRGAWGICPNCLGYGRRFHQ